MRIKDMLLQALRCLRISRLRTFLTVLGLSVGVAAIVSVGSIGKAGIGEVERELGRFGTDRLWVNAKNGGTISDSDVRLLERLVPESSFCPVLNVDATVTCGQKSLSTSLIATTQDYGQIENFTIETGRFLLKQDQDRGLRTAVVEDTIAHSLLADGAVGQEICISDVRFTVVGVIKTYYSQFTGESGKPKVFVPLSSLESAGASMNCVMAKVDGELSEAVTDIYGVLSRLHEDRSYTVSSMRSQIESAQKIIRIFRGVLLCIGAICMLAGGVGVMNILLASLNERRREIGIRKALGAKDGDIAGQFLFEAALYGCLGALAGLMLGILFTAAGSRIIAVPADVDMGIYSMAVLVSCGFAVAFGAYPANRAARIPPVTAMRPQS